MINCPDYKKATNSAYELLLSIDKVSLNTNIFKILSTFENIFVISYSEAREIYYIDRELLMCSSEFATTFKKGNRYIVCYNDYKDDCIIRFSMAHELGHIVLKHSYETDAFEKEANCFARNLLCPIVLARELHFTSVKSYAYVFGVSEPMAKIAIDYQERDYYYITGHNYQAFNEKTFFDKTGSNLEEFDRFCFSL